MVFNPEKCVFAKEEITFFGHKINKQGIQPTPQKIQIIKDFPKPTNLKELQRFIGMINFCNRFIPKMAVILQPIINAIKGSKSINLNSVQIDSFEKAK